MPVTNFSDYLNKTNHVWTHSPVCKQSGEVFKLFDKKVYIIRDPRDMAISASKYYCSDYMLKFFPQEEKDPVAFLEKNFDSLIQDWVWHVWDHLRLREKHHIHISFFEGFNRQFQEELSAVLDYLDTDLDAGHKSALEEAVSFDTLKKENPKHLNKGTSGYWKDRLTDDQKEKAEIIAGPLLRFLSYPENSSKTNFAGYLPHNNFDQLKREIIASQRPLYV